MQLREDRPGGRRDARAPAATGSDQGAYAKGFFHEPTVFVDVDPKMRIAREEIFGPVVSVIPCESLDEAIAIGNGVDYGLSASIYTQDINRAFQAMRDLYTGIFYVNAPTIGAEVHLPFGGTKNTGNGHREAGVAALDVFSEWKSIYIDFSGKLQRAQIDIEADLSRQCWSRLAWHCARATWLARIDPHPDIRAPVCDSSMLKFAVPQLRGLLRYLIARDPVHWSSTWARVRCWLGIHSPASSSANTAAAAARGQRLRRRCSAGAASGKARSGCSGTRSRPAWRCGASARSASPSRPAHRPPHWVQWHTMFSLCGGIGPLVALLALPHRGAAQVDGVGGRRRSRQLRDADGVRLRLLHHGAQRGAGRRRPSPQASLLCAGPGPAAAALGRPGRQRLGRAARRPGATRSCGSRPAPRSASSCAWSTSGAISSGTVSRGQRLRPRVDRAVHLLPVGGARGTRVRRRRGAGARCRGRTGARLLSAAPVLPDSARSASGCCGSSRSAIPATRSALLLTSWRWSAGLGVC